MTTATHSGFWAWLAGPVPQAKTGPERKPRAGPVFIHDAVVPWKDSTLLYAMMREDLDDSETRQDPLN